MNKILVISPSGNLYGSEQVLLDYLKCTRQHFDVMLPIDSKFSAVASKALTTHQIQFFSERFLKKFYFNLFVKLFFGKYNTVYINEAGHNKYLLLLARIFKTKRFVIHVRIVEDTEVSRWKLFSGNNIQLISISKSIKEKLKQTSTLLYDLYLFSRNNLAPSSMGIGLVTNIGIIGRITYSKGLLDLDRVIDYVNRNNRGNPYKFKIYGDIQADVINDPVIEKLKNNDSVEFMGFVKLKNEIYKNIDIILHMSKTEGLGRIFLEAIDEGKPFVGFNSAGIGEIGELTGLDELLCDPIIEDFSKEVFTKLEEARNNYREYIMKIISKKKFAATVFSPELYTEKLDNILLG